jgi:hypothetical protein
MIARLFTSILQQIRTGIERLGRQRHVPGFTNRGGESLHLTELAENAGLAQSVISQLSVIAVQQRDLQTGVDETRELARDTLEGIQRVEERDSPRSTVTPRSSQPLLGVGTTRLIQASVQPRRSVRGHGVGQTAIAGQGQRSAVDMTVGKNVLSTTAASVVWPLLRVLGLIAGAGVLVAKTFQSVAGAAEKFGMRLIGVLDQFADVSPAVAGMRGVLEVYTRRDRMAVAMALTPQWRRELTTYKELLDHTREIRILSQQLGSQFRVAMMRIVTLVADIFNAVYGIYTYLFGESAKTQQAPKPPLNPIIEALRDVLRNQNAPRHWQPAPPPKRRPGVA